MTKKRNAGPLSKRKAKKFAKKALRRLGYKAPKKRHSHRSKQVKRNPPKLKRLTKSTGWMNASQVKIIKNGGQMKVLVRRKPKSRRR